MHIRMMSTVFRYIFTLYQNTDRERKRERMREYTLKLTLISRDHIV